MFQQNNYHAYPGPPPNTGPFDYELLISTQYKKNFCFDLMFILQLKGIVVLNASMNVCY